MPFFADDGIALNDGNLVCTICRKQVSADKKSRLSEHIGSKKHKKMAEMNPEERPMDFEPYTPNTKRLKMGNGSFSTPSSNKTYSKLDSGRANRDKSHEILLADTLVSIFLQFIFTKSRSVHNNSLDTWGTLNSDPLKDQLCSWFIDFY